MNGMLRIVAERVLEMAGEREDSGRSRVGEALCRACSATCASSEASGGLRRDRAFSSGGNEGTSRPPSRQGPGSPAVECTAQASCCRPAAPGWQPYAWTESSSVLVTMPTYGLAFSLLPAKLVF